LPSKIPNGAPRLCKIPPGNPLICDLDFERMNNSLRPGSLPLDEAPSLIGGKVRFQARRRCWVILLLTMLAIQSTRSFGADISFRNEVQRSLDQGLAWLQAQQNSNGWWSTPDHPAVTALALTAFAGEPTGRFKTPTPELTKGYAFLTQSAKPDGGIYTRELTSYNTSLAMMALLTAPGGNYDSIVTRARGYLVGLQDDRGRLGQLDTPFDGGIGYGGIQKDPDVNNTYTALQALYHSRHLIQDRGGKADKDLNWAAAIHFLEKCQNLPDRNREAYVSAYPQDRGGFIYHPGRSMAGGETNATTGKIALRSYGSISYAGLLSYIYADLKKEDPRVAAVMEWLRSNYTLEENPGMGQQGLYYYLHLLTKGLTAAGVDELVLKDGRRVGWRKEVAMRLMTLQQRDGSWINSSPRWWEKDSNLVTAYSVLALETIWRGL
jgi:squalene-hopene/tetraprenyl-beta-curcumene cyclase